MGKPKVPDALVQFKPGVLFLLKRYKVRKAITLYFSKKVNGEDSVATK